MKFGKQLLSQQISGWGPYYLDYKFLKKIINSLEKGRITDAALLATGMRPESAAPSSSTPTTPALQAAQQEQRRAQGQADGAAEADPNAAAAQRQAATEAATQMLIGGSASDGKGPDELQLHRAAFFFKLERELEKVSRGVLNGRIRLQNSTLTSLPPMFRSTHSICKRRRSSRSDFAR